MSIDYMIFVNTNDISTVQRTVGNVDGVTWNGHEMKIRGLHSLIWREMDLHWQDVMRTGYGEYGISVNWSLFGTHDKETDIFDVMRTLYGCAAALVHDDPQRSLSLMCNGETFFVFNTPDRLIVSPSYLHDFPHLLPTFGKPAELRNIRY